MPRGASAGLVNYAAEDAYAKSLELAEQILPAGMTKGGVSW
jgi:hypothetical protein